MHVSQATNIAVCGDILHSFVHACLSQATNVAVHGDILGSFMHACLTGNKHSSVW